MIRHIIFILVLVAVVHSMKEYRSDYEYNPKTDAFYKLHADSLWYKDAKTVCGAENAKVMLATPLDIVQAHGMLKRFPDIGEYIWTVDDGLPHESQEVVEGYDVFRGLPSPSGKCEVITRDGEGLKISCFNKCPFICKVEAKDVFYNSQCKVYSSEYHYIESQGSCYKVSRSALTWNGAYAECHAQGAHLLVLNSDEERQAVQELTLTVNPMGEPWYSVGIRAEDTKDGAPHVFKTIFGQTLKEAGYDGWSPGEPNNYNGHELCGSIVENDAKYNDIPCNNLVPYICEKEINK